MPNWDRLNLVQKTGQSFLALAVVLAIPFLVVGLAFGFWTLLLLMIPLGITGLVLDAVGTWFLR